MNRKVYNLLNEFLQEKFEIELSDVTGWEDFVTNVDDILLDEYFGWHTQRRVAGGYWTQQTHFNDRRTGMPMVNAIKSMGDNVKILDVGCGENEYKKYFGDNLIGIDPYNEKADLHIGIDEYEPEELFDVVTILGSLNFGDFDKIQRQVHKAVSLCKSGGKIYWRCNPGITHDHPRAKYIDFFEWSEDYIRQFADETACDVVEIDWDHPTGKHGRNVEIRWGNRFYSEWTKR